MQTQSLDLISQLDYVFAAPVPTSLSAKEYRAYYVGPFFDCKNEQVETACHVCGKSYKASLRVYISTEQNAGTEWKNFVRFRTIVLSCPCVRPSDEKHFFF